MGFYDKVRLDKAHPELGIPQGAAFETKSLHAESAEFTVTADGRLVEHLYRYERDPDELLRFPLGKRVALGDRMIDYHGDILLLGTGPEDRTKEFVARFTNGCLEWIRPAEEYPEANMDLLLEQGAR